MLSSIFFYFRYKKRVGQQVEKYRTSRVNREVREQAKEKITTLMASEKLYLNPDLNLQDLSSRLNLHPNYISRIINEQFQMSYNDFVNRHRIEEAKMKLKEEDEKSKTILEIMYDAGFYSKSVFNTAFKKFTGMTPSEYRRMHV
jgi:AraC-like DNA-binding protein